MIFARIDNIAIALVGDQTLISTHVRYLTAMRLIVKQLRRFAPLPYIPIAEARGFSAGFGKVF